MLLSYNWLKDLVGISKSLTPEKIAEKLTLHTVEVEGIIRPADKFNKVVIGKILEIKKHPNADRLQLTKIDVGASAILNIVCGAPNISVGQLVPVALEGAILPNGLEIKKAEVRGEISEGMLCALDELGLGDDHAGIFILDNKAKIGQEFSKYLKADDIVLEVDNKSLSNRPDLLCHYGMAREIATLFGLKIKETKIKNFAEKHKINDKDELIKLKVEVRDDKLCPRYMAIAVNNIKITESPKWIQDRLAAVGLRPINNIVDATNYVMLELGQPMHAFDASKIKEIIVRRAKSEEEIETLDGQKRKLDDKMLVITDGKQVVAIAGLMGGSNSEIAQETDTIVIESANFEPNQIRKTSQKLSLRTEASTRFEKSLDPNLCELALQRIIEIIKETCPKAAIASQLVDIKNFNLNQGPIELNLNWLNAFIGQEISKEKTMEVLKSLGFEISDNKQNDRILAVKVPSWRATRDVSIAEDLAEEIARIYGYNNIKATAPLVEMESPEINEKRKLERVVKEILSKASRLTEIYNYSFVGDEQLKKLNINFSKHIRLANPISVNHTMCRQSLAPNLMENIRFNQARYDSLRFYEFGSVFFDLPGGINKDVSRKCTLPYQEKKIGIIIAEEKNGLPYSEIKKVVENLFDFLNLDISYEKNENLIGWEDQFSAAKIKANGVDVGYLCLADKKIINSIGLKKETAIAEINFDLLFELVGKQPEKKYKELPKYPSLVRDLAFVISSKILYNNIKREIEDFNQLISRVELFDVYEEGKLGIGKKSLAFHLNYQSLERTLTGEEVDELQKELVKKLEAKFEAQIRNF